MNDTRKKSGSGTTEPPFFNQRIWRTIGAAAIAGAALMAWYGTAEVLRGVSRGMFIAYWGGFALLLLVALYMVLLDLRYIRLQYLVGRREVFRSTVGEEAFRRALLAAQKEHAAGKAMDESSSSEQRNTLS